MKKKVKSTQKGRWCDISIFVKIVESDKLELDDNDNKSLPVFKKLSIIFHPDKHPYGEKMFIFISKNSKDEKILEKIWENRDNLKSEKEIDKYLSLLEKDSSECQKSCTYDDYYYQWFFDRTTNLPIDQFMFTEKATISLIKDMTLENLLKVYLAVDQNWVNDSIFERIGEKLKSISIYEYEKIVPLVKTHRVKQLFKHKLNELVRKMYENIHPSLYYSEYVDIAQKYNIIFDDMHNTFKERVKTELFTNVSLNKNIYNFLDPKLKKYIDSKFIDSFDREVTFLKDISESEKNTDKNFYKKTLPCSLLFLLRKYKDIELHFLDDKIHSLLDFLQKHKNIISNDQYLDEIQILFQ